MILLNRLRTAGRDDHRPLPRAAWLCAFAVTLNTLAWSLITPLFHVPDETVHVAYVQSLAEQHRPPGDAAKAIYSDEEANLISATGFNSVVGQQNERGIWTPQQQQGLRRRLSQERNPANGGGPSTASSQPPLYYALQLAPYYLSPSGKLSQRVALMRCLSAFLTGITVLFVFLVLRECFPSSPWAWTSGSLAAGFEPVLGFVGGGVNSDALLVLASALTVWATMRAFRLGLTARTGSVIGAALATGLLTKINFLALLPAVAVAIATLVWLSDARLVALKGAAAAATVAVVPAMVYVLINVLIWHRAAWAQSLQTQVQQLGHGRTAVEPLSVRDQLSYSWQLFLPRLPFMHEQFSYFPPFDSWLPNVIGIFGWLDTRWDPWVYRVGKVAFGAVVGLAGVGLVRGRKSVVRRRPEAVFLICIPIGLAAELGMFGIRYLRETGYAFEQGRYLLPLLCLYAIGIVFAARSVAPRRAPALGAGLVVAAFAHSVLAQLLTVSRFYG